jgi:hypothetical protein
MRFSYLIILLLLSFGASAQVYQNMAQPGYKFGRARFDSVLTIPSGLGTMRNITGGKDTGQIRFNLSDSSVYVWNGRAWIKPAGSEVDSIYTEGDSLLYLKQGSEIFVANLANATAGGDTTIFQVVLDSTGQQNNRLLFSKDNKISSSAWFLADDVNRKIVLGNNNISVGGTGIKLWVQGTAQFNGNLYVAGVLQAEGTQQGAGNKAMRFNTSTGFLTYADTTIAIDTTSLSNRINLKVNIADTASMLSNYAKSSAVALKVNISDTAAMLQPYLDTLQSHNTRIIAAGGGGASGWSLTGNSSAVTDFLGTTNNRTLRFRTNNVERLLIDSIGNIQSNGQYTNLNSNNYSSAPIALRTNNADVSGLSIYKGSFAHTNSIQFLNNSISERFSIGQGFIGNSTLSDFSIARYVSSAWSEAFRIFNATGNVAIGTTTDAASALLNVSSTTKGILIPRMTTAQRDLISTPATGLQVYNTSSNTFDYYNGSTWGGIGGGSTDTTSLSNRINLKLNISDTSAMLKPYLDTLQAHNTRIIAAGGGGASGWSLTGNSSAVTDFLGTTNNRTMRFRTNNTERMVIDSVGNVGIGTATPTFKLDVNGTARVSGALTLGAASGIGMTIQDNTAIRGTAATGGNLYIDGNASFDNTGTINLRGAVTTSSTLTVGSTLRVNGSSISLPYNGSLRTTSGSNGQIFIEPAIDLTGSVFVRGTTFVVESTGGVPTTFASAIVAFNSTTKGILIPRMTTAQRNAISTPATALQVFSTTDSTNYIYRGTTSGWQATITGIRGSGTLDFGSITHHSEEVLTISVTGAAEGDVVSLGVPNASNLTNVIYTAWVSAADTVSVKCSNLDQSAAKDPASGTFKVTVFK